MPGLRIVAGTVPDKLQLYQCSVSIERRAEIVAGIDPDIVLYDMSKFLTAAAAAAAEVVVVVVVCVPLAVRVCVCACVRHYY